MHAANTFPQCSIEHVEWETHKGMHLAVIRYALVSVTDRSSTSPGSHHDVLNVATVHRDVGIELLATLERWIRCLGESLFTTSAALL